MTFRRVAIGVISVLSVASTQAMAGGSSRPGGGGGALSQATSAVRGSVGAPSRPGGGAPSPAPAPQPGYTYYPEHGPMICAGCTPAVMWPVASAPPPEPIRLLLEAGLHSVEGSNGAVVGGLQAARGGVGVDLAAARYVERGRALDGASVLRMTVWSFALLGRVLDAGATELWLSGGLAGAESSEFASLTGPMVGVELVHRLSERFEARGSARYLLLDQAMHASELRAALRASSLSVGYRVFRFEVGPPLRGPEIGLALRF